MLFRWDTTVENINLVLDKVRKIIRRALPKREGRGRKPKHNVADYATLVVLKEYEKRTLRGAEVMLSKLVCKERVDHSVISYWERISLV